MCSYYYTHINMLSQLSKQHFPCDLKGLLGDQMQKNREERKSVAMCSLGFSPAPELSSEHHSL